MCLAQISKETKTSRNSTFTKMVCATEDRTQCILSEKPRCLWGFGLAHSHWAPFHVAFPQHLVSKSHLHTMPWKNQPCSAGEKARVQDEKNIEKPCHAHCRLQNLQISGNYSSSCTWHFRIFIAWPNQRSQRGEVWQKDHPQLPDPSFENPWKSNMQSENPNTTHIEN